jgi:hypothetical protein
MLPTKFRFIWQSGYRGEDFSEINQSETRIACGMFVNGSGQNEQSLERTTAIDASYQVSVHLAKRFQRRFLKIGQSELEIFLSKIYFY